MNSKAALFALLAMWGVGSCAALPAIAEEAGSGTEAREDGTPAKRSFTNRVWLKTNADDLPGAFKIFLSDGTLVQDSCWETHRLSPWEMASDTSVTWNEDGMDISADIISVSASDLVLNVRLASGTVEERYTAATTPYLCPDMPK